MVQKRPFEDEEQYEISCKLQKQLKHAHQLPLSSETGTSEVGPHVDATGEDEFKDKDKALEKITGNNLVSPPLGYKEETDYSEGDIQSDKPFHVSFFSEYFYPDNGVRTSTRHEDIYSLHLQQPPLKPVHIGSNYQADIPPWDPHDAKKISSYLCSTSEVVPDFFQDEVGAGRSECGCYDKGSIRCVRQHVAEAREKLRRNLGSEEFEDFWFLDMGEQVAEKWTKEEELLFREIVLSSPHSVGRNFWNILSSAFPSRTKREIVSYYFNVFMLRRRAEQNRFDPLNADSDNDEWRLSDEDIDDSVVESPEWHIGVNKSSEDDVDEFDEDAEIEQEGLAFKMAKKDCGNGQDGDITSKFEEHTYDDRMDRDQQETQDDSCTSFDNGVAPASSETQLKDDNRDQLPSGCNTLINTSSGHDYALDPCDAKLWDVGYVSHPKREVDFLPTCSMIKEVFGDESWNCKMDGKGSSV